MANSTFPARGCGSYNDSTVTHAYDRLEELGYVTVERHKRAKDGGPGRGKTNKLHPSFMLIDNVAVSQPISNDSDEIKRCEPRHKTLRATSQNVAGPQHDSMKVIKRNERRASLASPPDGGSRSAASTPSKKDSRQEDGERLNDGAQRATAEEVREIVKRLRVPLETPEAGKHKKRVAASNQLSRTDRPAFWLKEMGRCCSSRTRGRERW